MAEIISVDKIGSLGRKIKKQGKKIVLAGGCFDILHPGHVSFLEKAKKTGDCLLVFLESDQKVRIQKGQDRPFHSQKDRAKALSALRAPDYIINLPYLKTDREYDGLVADLVPDVIAATSKDDNLHHKRSAKLTGAKFKLVTRVVGGFSSSKLQL